MSEYNVHLAWKRETEDFNYQTYNRKHTVFFYGGPRIEVDTAPDYLRNPQFHTPEELMAASLSSCFLLTFLALCAKEGHVVDSYRDQVTCILDKIDEHRQGITEIILRPVVEFKPETKPDKEGFNELFQLAHERCFIANSLKTQITVNPDFAEH